MCETYGDYEEAGDEILEFLQIGFSPSSVCIQERWRNNGLSADFLGDYLSTFFPGDDPESTERRLEIKDAVSYIANELLENAMKYTYHPSKNSVDILMKLDTETIVFYVSNSVEPNSLEQFRGFIQKLITEDPQEMYMEQMLSNLEDVTDMEPETEPETDSEAEASMAGGSGLGLLTMLNDYDAKLGWQFSFPDSEPQNPKVTTMVKVEI